MAAALLTAGIATALSACGGSSSGGGGSSTGSGSTGTASTSSAGTTQAATTQAATTAAQSSSSSGGGSSSASDAGLKVFTSAGCGSCHTLAAAHAKGTVGPNLDDLKPSESEVATQVTNGGGAMPSFANKLSKAQIQAVAKFVASAAG